jgi:hypothetical protein
MRNGGKDPLSRIPKECSLVIIQVQRVHVRPDNAVRDRPADIVARELHRHQILREPVVGSEGPSGAHVGHVNTPQLGVGWDSGW